MKILLDTCTFLWIDIGSKKLSKKAEDLFLDPDNDIYLSVVSLWEIVIKYQLKRLPLPKPPKEHIPNICKKLGINTLNLDEESVFHLTHFPPYHVDPFDRMLICQALVHGLIILTPDINISQYPARTMW